MTTLNIAYALLACLFLVAGAFVFFLVRTARSTFKDDDWQHDVREFMNREQRIQHYARMLEDKRPQQAEKPKTQKQKPLAKRWQRRLK